MEDASYLKIGNDVVKYKSIACEINGISGIEYCEPHVNVQVQVTNRCNANCRFCTFHNDSKAKFNTDIFLEGIEKLHSRFRIPTVTFTGGETSFEFDAISNCIPIIRNMSSDTRIKINTNGTRIRDFLRIPDVWQISLSRHSIIDDENYSIFGTQSVPSNSEIDMLCNYENLQKLHISCTMIKGYVDSYEKMVEFTNYYGNKGILDIGFVSLMGVNKYAREHLIDFESFNIKQNPELLFGRHCKYIKSDKKCHCECQVYYILTSSGNIVEAYNRFARDYGNCDESNVVYAINQWRQGFSGRLLDIV